MQGKEDQPKFRLNEFGQPIGLAIPNWTPPPVPPREPMVGKYCRLEPLKADVHGPALWEAYSLDPKGINWTYLLNGPFTSYDLYYNYLKNTETKSDPILFAILDVTGKPVGSASYMRIEPTHGCIEVGSINYSPLLQHTTAATECMYLMMKRAFELGYRRYEWKCDALNEPSRRAAKRLGFTYEGRFRQAVVVKGRNRDTDWFSIIDFEWPRLKAGFERWLAPNNFDADGRQKQSLNQCMEVK